MVLAHPRDILCRYLARRHAERTRFGELFTIHVSDLVSRADFVYLERVGAPVPICGHLARMHMGFMWEKEVESEMARRGYVHEPEYVARVIAELAFPDGHTERREYTLVAHPDFVLNPTRPEHIVEMKSTRWDKKEVEVIVRGQISMLRRFDYPFPEELWDEGTNAPRFPAFWNWLFQVAVYRWYHGWRRRVPVTLLAIFRNSVDEFNVPESGLRALLEAPVARGGPSTFDSRLAIVIQALELARRGYDPLHPLALAVIEQVHPIGMMGYIGNDDRLVTEGYTLPYFKLTNYDYERDAWIFAVWREVFGLSRRPILLGEPIPRMPVDVCREIQRRYRDAIDRICASSEPEKRMWCVLIRNCIMGAPNIAKAELVRYYATYLFPFLARLAGVLAERLNVPAVRIIRKAPVGVSRSPLQITEEAVEQKLERLEARLQEEPEVSETEPEELVPHI